MRVLITGSNGFIGRVITQHLASRGYEVYGLNRNLPRFQSYTKGDFACDIRDLKSLQKIVHKHKWDGIIHAAAIIDITDGQPNDVFGSNGDMTTTNTIGTHNLLNATRGRTEHFIYLSSMGVIGAPIDHPITETHPINSHGLYHGSKVLGEKILSLPYYDEGQFYILRLAPPIGPGMDASKILPTFTRHALANEPLIVHGYGKREQDYIDVRDIAHAIERIFITHAVPAGVFNIASGKTLTNLELAERCISHLNSASDIQFQGKDPQDNITWDISIEKAHRLLGFYPIYEVEHTIDAIVGSQLYQQKDKR